jgi:hypothetical protein
MEFTSEDIRKVSLKDGKLTIQTAIKNDGKENNHTLKGDDYHKDLVIALKDLKNVVIINNELSKTFNDRIDVHTVEVKYVKNERLVQITANLILQNSLEPAEIKTCKMWNSIITNENLTLIEDILVRASDYLNGEVGYVQCKLDTSFDDDSEEE